MHASPYTVCVHMCVQAATVTKSVMLMLRVELTAISQDPTAPVGGLCSKLEAGSQQALAILYGITTDQVG